MFVGHYSVSFAVKAVKPAIPLWVLFIAVQLVDVFWAIFVWLGIEKVRIVPGITATNPLDLYYMPYTHSLVAAVAWSVIGYLAYRAWRRGSAHEAALLLGLAVFSHWILDFLVHRPDLPLYDNTAKVGLGIWNFPAPALLLETGLLFAGLVWYLRATKPLTGGGRWGMFMFGFAMIGLQIMAFFGAPPTSDRMAASVGLGSYVVLASIAAWLERKRVTHESAA